MSQTAPDLPLLIQSFYPVIIAALYETLYQQQTLTTETLPGEISRTVPLFRTIAEDLQRLWAEAAGKFVPVTSNQSP